jgi:hypothetical protein
VLNIEYRTRNFEQQKFLKAGAMFFRSIFCSFLFCGSTVHILKDVIAESSNFLLIRILVEMFSGEGQFIVQPVGEKNLIESRTAVLEPG